MKENIAIHKKRRRHKYYTIEMLYKCDLSSHLTNCQVLYEKLKGVIQGVNLMICMRKKRQKCRKDDDLHFFCI